MERPIKVLWADDSNLLLLAFQRLVENHPSLKWVGQAWSATQALEMAGERKPDVVVFDLSMPGEDPLCAVQRLSSAGVAVLVVSGHDDRNSRSNCKEAGAAGFMSKVSEPAAIISAIEAVGSGRAVW